MGKECQQCLEDTLYFFNITGIIIGKTQNKAKKFKMVSKFKKDGTQLKKLNVKIGTKIIEMKNWMNLEFFRAK